MGTDPNYKLTEKLHECSTLYKKVTRNTSVVDIRTQGSETLIPEWISTMGLIFSSPPYFNLEDYKCGEQSINHRSYQEWLSEYWRPTVKNTKQYITKNGYFLLNIKNFDKYKLLDDMKQICIEEGFNYLHSIELNNINRPILSQNEKNNNEEILVFSLMAEHILVKESLDEWE